MFVRHTLNAIYTNLGIELCGVRHQSLPPHIPLQPHPRNLRISIGLLVSGQARLTGQPAEWRMYVRKLYKCHSVLRFDYCSYSTYTFEPINALISHHRIDSILPEPHKGALDLLRRVLDATSTGMVGQYIPLPIQHRKIWLKWYQIYQYRGNHIPP